MIVLISGSNRPGNNTRHVACALEALLRKAGQEVFLIDLEELPLELFSPSAYHQKPASFAPLQEAVLKADGILTVVSSSYLIGIVGYMLLYTTQLAEFGFY